VIEAMFEQRVRGADAEFVGAVPAQLSPAVVGRMADEALRLATLFQDLGYFGRCSFDCLVTGVAGAPAALHWIECNGRWGGVSVPMTLVNRLLGNHAAHGLVVVQNAHLDLAVKGVDSALARLGPLLLRRDGRQGVVPLTGRGFEAGAGVYFLAVAPTQEEAERLTAEAVARLTEGP